MVSRISGSRTCNHSCIPCAFLLVMLMPVLSKSIGDPLLCKMVCSKSRCYSKAFSGISAMFCTALDIIWSVVPSASEWCSLYRPLQVLSSHCSEVNDLLDEYQAKNVRRENISIQIYVECNNMHWKNCLLSRILVYLVWPRYSTWASRKWNPTHKQLVQVCKIWEFIYQFCPFFPSRFIQTFGLVVKASCSVLGDMSLIPAGCPRCWNFVPALGYFAWYCTLY